VVRTLKGMTLIPTNAIQHNGQGTFVYVIRKDTATMQTVKTGVEDSGMTAVEGIQPGDVVATSSFNKLQNDSKVALSKQPVPPATTRSMSP